MQYNTHTHTRHDMLSLSHILNEYACISTLSHTTTRKDMHFANLRLAAKQLSASTLKETTHKKRKPIHELNALKLKCTNAIDETKAKGYGNKPQNDRTTKRLI